MKTAAIGDSYCGASASVAEVFGLALFASVPDAWRLELMVGPFVFAVWWAPRPPFPPTKPE